MHCDAEPGEAEPGMAASPGRGIYKPVRTDYHEPLGAGGTGENLDLLERLVGKVPIYHLACDISEDAVKTLEQELMRDSSEEAAAAAFLQKMRCGKWRKKHEAGRHPRLCRNAKRAGRAGKRSADGDFREQHGTVSDPRAGQHFFRAPERELRKGDIVFYERPGGQFVVHRICGVHGESYDLIGDGQTEIEHNVRREQIFARVTQVERKGKRLAPGSFWWGFLRRSGFE